MGRADRLLALLKQMCQMLWPLLPEELEEFAKELAKELAKETGKQGLQYAYGEFVQGLSQLLDPVPPPPTPNRSVVLRTDRLAFDPLGHGGAVLRSKQVLKKASDLGNIISGKAPMKLFHVAPAPTTAAVGNILKSPEILRAGHRAPGINTDSLSIFAKKTPATASSAEPGALVEKALGSEVPAQATNGTLVDKALGDEVPAQATIGTLVENALGDQAPAPETIDALENMFGDNAPAPAIIDALESKVGDKAPASATIGALGSVLGGKVAAPAVQHQAPALALEEDAGDSRAVLYFILACNGVLLVIVGYKVLRWYWGRGGGGEDGQAGAAAAPQAAAAATPAVDPQAGAKVDGERSTSQEPQEAVVDVPAPSAGEEPQEAAGDGNGGVDDNNSNADK